jgi:hypothetical protein
MKKIIALCLMLVLSFTSFTAYGGGKKQAERVKYATIFVIFRGIAKPIMMVVWEGQSKKIKVDANGFLDNEETSFSIFSAIHTEMEELNKLGYVLATTSVAGANGSVLMYTLEKGE